MDYEEKQGKNRIVECESVIDWNRLFTVAETEMAQLLPLLKQMALLPERDEPWVIAIDGRSASGKTTAAVWLEKVLGAGIIHVDDFFLPTELRTKERLAQPGGNVHYERFINEVLPKLKSQEAFSYQRFDCSIMAPGEMRQVSASCWRIVEGAYSLHPILGDYADITVFFHIEPQKQLRRIAQRGGEEAVRAFSQRWIPLEEKYIKSLNIQERAQLRIDV